MARYFLSCSFSSGVRPSSSHLMLGSFRLSSSSRFFWSFCSPSRVFGFYLVKFLRAAARSGLKYDGEMVVRSSSSSFYCIGESDRSSFWCLRFLKRFFWYGSKPLKPGWNSSIGTPLTMMSSRFSISSYSSGVRILPSALSLKRSLKRRCYSGFKLSKPGWFSSMGRPFLMISLRKS